jgi:positive regulator of sigma E activity
MRAAGADKVIVFLVSFLACGFFAAAMTLAVLAATQGKKGIIPIVLVFIVGLGMFWLLRRWAKSMRRENWTNL